MWKQTGIHCDVFHCTFWLLLSTSRWVNHFLVILMAKLVMAKLLQPDTDLSSLQLVGFLRPPCCDVEWSLFLALYFIFQNAFCHLLKLSRRNQHLHSSPFMGESYEDRLSYPRNEICLAEKLGHSLANWGKRKEVAIATVMCFLRFVSLFTLMLYKLFHFILSLL